MSNINVNVIQDENDDSSADDADCNPVDVLADEFAKTNSPMAKPRPLKTMSPPIRTLNHRSVPYSLPLPEWKKSVDNNFPTLVSHALKHHVELNLKKIGDFEILGQLGQGGNGNCL